MTLASERLAATAAPGHRRGSSQVRGHVLHSKCAFRKGPACLTVVRAIAVESVAAANRFVPVSSAKKIVADGRLIHAFNNIVTINFDRQATYPSTPGSSWSRLAQERTPCSLPQVAA